MNVQDFFGDRGLSILDKLIFLGLTAFATYILPKISSKAYFVRFSLRTRITISVVITTLIGLGTLYVGLNAYIAVLVLAIALTIIIQSILSQLSKVGILNAFSTTKKGISAATSLKMVKSEMSFLGVGAKKLTDDEEFERALTRCAAESGKARFLLSTPDNPALSLIAQRNQRDEFSYRSRVIESIREIFHKAGRTGVDFEVRVYSLQQEFAFPHFRLFFIDGDICLFSHVVWNAAEGLDNPQLVLRKDTKKRPNSLYKAFRKYFDDLWESDAAETVTPAMLDSWSR